jgi:hypothetical protein
VIINDRGVGVEAISDVFLVKIDLGKGQFLVCDRWEMASP